MNINDRDDNDIAVTCCIRLLPAIRSKIKVIAAQKEVSIRSIYEECLLGYISRHEKKMIKRK